MGIFYVDTSTGSVATAGQLAALGIEEPALPWLRIQGAGDASTLWHAVLVKEERGVFIGTLALRHGSHHGLLVKSGWREVPPAAIGSTLPGADGEVTLSPSPWSTADPDQEM